MKRVLVVGSAEQSGGGVSSVIKLMKKMPVWEEYGCYWLGTQIQRNYLWKAWYAIKANIIALFIIWKYDIVHIHTVPDINNMIIQLPVFLFAKIGRKKIIMHVHVGNQLMQHTNDKLFKWLLNGADLIVLLARKWEELLKREYADVKTPTTVIYNACDVVPEVSFEEKTKTIIMAAYYCENKAPDLLLKAWKNIRDNFSDKYSEWKVCMLGNGEVDRYQKMADDLGLSASVSFPGYVVGDEREDFFRKGSVYCMCSYNEGFPMVVLEAWAYGINVVTTPVGGLPDVLEDGKNAMVFPFGEHEALAKHLMRLMDDEELRRDMASYSREFVLSHFSLDTINEDVREVYSSLS